MSHDICMLFGAPQYPPPIDSLCYKINEEDSDDEASEPKAPLARQRRPHNQMCG
eukprot:CAMPEP_0181168018 /NCGR_PEP_ID=MMETSP1096-20121128/35_1 /TAXON_ID=156174 ORGANISM="Chrysochromulina ericina, Strain CCMP281" /NCGR_SAMPLE_ID=MMETSP1096 /ASSEMBLY_ACC=CAM_ASM_000453 /LENGTH=53 /DNA_ID=CAMNT_0023255337 /DNA_START=94 /DNA_END=255 /DNA_ORIENTATION=-